MEQIDGLASNIGYAVITSFVSLVALYAVIRWKAAWIGAKFMFLCAWGIVSVIAPLYSFLAISVPAGKEISGGIASLACLILIGGPFVYFGWPKLRRMFAR